MDLQPLDLQDLLPPLNLMDLQDLQPPLNGFAATLAGGDVNAGGAGARTYKCC